MIPRFVRIVEDLPKTPTEKVEEAPPTRYWRDRRYLGPRGGRDSHQTRSAQRHKVSIRTHDGAVTTDLPEAESRHRYPRRAIFTEYFYAAFGILLTLAPFAVVMPLKPIAGILAALGLLFVAFGVRTMVRHRTSIRIDDDGLIVDGLVRKRLMWEKLTRLPTRVLFDEARPTGRLDAAQAESGRYEHSHRLADRGV